METIMERTAHTPVVKKVAEVKNKEPCNWNITPNKDGTIVAVNIVNNFTFKGTMKDFNAMIN